MTSEKNTCLATVDDAVKFSLAYLAILERNLGIEYSPQGEPICMPSIITPFVISELIRELDELFKGDASSKAIDTCKKYGEKHIQSIGFGHVSDFDAFIKIGLLYSERVIIWDILASRILRNKYIKETSSSIIADIACNLLLLRPVIDLGGVIVLPHPLMWSENARNIAAESFAAEERSSTALGLLFAMVAIDEGLPLHPYTLTISRSDTQPADSDLAKQHYPDATSNLTFGLASLMATDEFSFLRSIRIDEFHRIVMNHPSLHRALRKQFASLSGLSEIQSIVEIESIQDEIKKLSADRDKSIGNYWLDASLASAGVVTGTLTMAASPAGATLFALLGLSPTAITAVRRIISRPSKNVIVQAFSAFRTSQPFTLEFSTSIPDIKGITERQIDPELIEHISIIEKEYWTEDVNIYLEGLEKTVSVAVMNALLPEQIDRLLNYRSRQEDYIGDYLEFVWDSSPSAFWNHIKQSFTSAAGMVMYDGDAVHQVLISENMPNDVWITLIKFIPSVYRDVLRNNIPKKYKEETGDYVVEYQISQLSDVVAYQLLYSVGHVEKQAIFKLWLLNLGKDERATVDILLQRIFPVALPHWLS